MVGGGRDGAVHGAVRRHRLSAYRFICGRCFPDMISAGDGEGCRSWVLGWALSSSHLRDMQDQR